MENDVLKDIQDARNESFKLYGTFLEKAERDEKVSLGDQWNDADKEKLSEEKRPILNINLVAKGCGLISGQQRQNPMDIVYYPIENTDRMSADIYTELVKWLFTNGEFKTHRNLAFDDTTRTGIGWLAPEMNYDLDPVYGDIKLNHESIYTIYPDPYLTDLTLSDCEYIIRHKYLQKARAQNLYPGFEDDIEHLETKSSPQIKPLVSTKDKVYVTERWYRTYETVNVIIDPFTLRSKIWEGKKSDFNKAKEAIPEMASFKLISRNVSVIKLQASINDTIVVYDGDVPDGMSKSKYPFIPIWGFFTPHYNEEAWDLKLQGYARGLIDSQTEKNKTRSILMDGMMRSLRSRFVMEKGAFETPDDITSSSGKPLIIKPGYFDKWKELQPPVIDAAMIQLEQMHTNDIREMGLNPDLLAVGGDGASAPSAPTSSLQLRSKQGMMSIQALYDNMGLANRMLGLYFIDLINMWPKDKIEKVLGRQIPQDWDIKKINARYDCVADEKSSSPTYKQSVYMQLQGLVQHGGIQVPPQIMRQFLELPEKVEQEWQQIDQANAQSQQQMSQMQQQLQQAAMQIEIQKEQIRQQGELLRTKLEEAGDNERLEKKLMNDFAIAKIKANTQKSKTNQKV